MVKIEDVYELEVDGVDSGDYPDFCDAYFSNGKIDGRDLTEDELDYLSEEYPEKLSEMAFEYYIP